MADYSIILLIKGGNLSGTNSYQSLVQSTFGLPGFLILSGLQFLYPFIGKLSKMNKIQLKLRDVNFDMFLSYFQWGLKSDCIFCYSLAAAVLCILTSRSVLVIEPNICFLPQLWLVTISQQVTQWPKYFREYREVRSLLSEVEWCLFLFPL